MPLPPLDIKEAVSFGIVQMDDVVLKNPSLQPVLFNYRENLRLAQGVIAVPGFSALITMQQSEADTKAWYEVVGKDNHFTPSRLSNLSPQQAKKFQFLKLKYLSELVEKTKPLQRDNLTRYTGMVENNARHCGDFVYGMFKGILRIYTVQCWGAFEVMASMLMESAMATNNPRLVIPKNPHRMASYNGISKAYGTTFDHDNADILAALTDTVVAPLAVLRNVIVHNACRVDDDFINRSANYPEFIQARNQSNGSPIEVDGNLAKEISQKAVMNGYELIEAVDEWLTDHP